MPARKPEQKIDMLALALASGQTVAGWARANGVPVATAYRWTNDKAFKARVGALRTEMTSRAVGRLTKAAAKAVATLVSLLAEKTPDATRLGAARAILQSLIEVQKHSELTQRLDDLEKRLNEQSARPARAYGRRA